MGHVATARRDRTLYPEIRSDHAKARQKKSRANRRDLRNAQIPMMIGDLAHEGVTASGKLEYKWNDVRVEATPRRLRASVIEGDSRVRHQRDREHTPQRAFRKMMEKVNRRAAQAYRGDYPRIIVSDEHTNNNPPVPTGGAPVPISDAVAVVERRRRRARGVSQLLAPQADQAGQPLLSMEVGPRPGWRFCEKNQDEAALIPHLELDDAGTFECELCLASLPRDFLGFQCLGCGLKLCSRCWCYDADRSKPCACGYAPREAQMAFPAAGLQLPHPWVLEVQSTDEGSSSATTHDGPDIDQVIGRHQYEEISNR
jgi:hypothetical protein